MRNYLQPKDDGLLMHPSDRWVVEKLDYLRRYLGVFTVAMRERWYSMHYIDLFSGPGKCRLKNSGAVHLGSPLIALTAPRPFNHYFFVDLDAQYIETLEQRCRASPLSQHVECIAGDANIAVQGIVNRIRALDRIRGTSLNLAFLDPYALELQWKTVARLASLDRMDLIIYYPQYALNRAMKPALQAEKTSAVDLFFGSTEWRNIYTDWQSSSQAVGIHRLLIDHYKGNLAHLGYEQARNGQIGEEPLIRSARSRGPLYRLLFASKHPLGLKFWREVNRRDVYGQKRMPFC